MKTKVNTFIAFLLALVLTVSSFGPASAKTANKPDGPDCRITASTTTPVVGEPVQLTVSTSLVGPVSVYFGDGTEVQNGRSLWHTFHYVGRPVATAAVWYENRAVTACSFDFTVSASTYNDLGLGGGMDFPELEFEDESGELPVPPTVVEVPVMTVGDIASYENGMADNTGENAFSVVNTGEGNVDLTIEQAPAPVVAPTPVAPIVPDDNSCSGYCASNGGVININPLPAQNSLAVKTMPTNFWAMFFYTIFDGISSPFENWKAWLVENK
jgi:hypothetical protein